MAETAQVVYPNVMQAMGSNILRLTDTSELFDDVALYLRGLIRLEDGRLSKIGEPRMSEEGIGEVLGLLHGIATRNTHLSNYEMSEVRSMCNALIYELSRIFMLYGRKWGLEVNKRSITGYMITQIFFTSLKRGFKEGDKKFLKGSQQEIKTTVESNTRGGLSKYFNAFKRD
jgi:hypothetical protein